MKYFTNEHSRNTLVGALRQILRPLVKLLIHYQITFPALRDLLKSIYVEVAAEIIEADGGAANHSRIYILSGVHRKDIRRLLEQNPPAASNTNPSLGGELIARWTAQDEFLDDNGEPRALDKSGSDEQPGFEQLVSSVSKDIRPRAMLDEWLRQGLVSFEGDVVVLNTRAFVPLEDFNNQCYYLARNNHDHLASSVHNLLAEGEPMLERSVYYANLSSQSIQFLRELATTRAQQLLSDINKQAMRLHEQDAGRVDATHRFTLGTYWYQQDETS